MLEKVLLETLGGRKAIEGRVRAELERLLAGGYLDAAEVERIAAQSLEALQGSVAEAGKKLEPLVAALSGSAVAAGGAKALRDLLDVPSRSELEALRAELREKGLIDRVSEVPPPARP